MFFTVLRAFVFGLHFHPAAGLIWGPPLLGCANQFLSVIPCLFRKIETISVSPAFINSGGIVRYGKIIWQIFAVQNGHCARALRVCSLPVCAAGKERRSLTTKQKPLLPLGALFLGHCSCRPPAQKTPDGKAETFYRIACIGRNGGTISYSGRWDATSLCIEGASENRLPLSCYGSDEFSSPQGRASYAAADGVVNTGSHWSCGVSVRRSHGSGLAAICGQSHRALQTAETLSHGGSCLYAQDLQAG